MPHHIRRAITVSVAAGALLALGAGLAYADDSGDDSDYGDSGSRSAPHETQPGSGSGLSGGPTDFQLLHGAPGVPVPDPTLGEGTLLPPAYNGYSTVTGS
jgi:hypothetical protein